MGMATDCKNGLGSFGGQQRSSVLGVSLMFHRCSHLDGVDHTVTLSVCVPEHWPR